MIQKNSFRFLSAALMLAAAAPLAVAQQPGSSPGDTFTGTTSVVPSQTPIEMPLITLDGQPLATTGGSFLFTEQNEPIQVLPIQIQQPMASAPIAQTPISNSQVLMSVEQMIRQPIDQYRTMSDLRTNNFFISATEVPNPVRGAQVNEHGSFEWTPTGYCWCTPSFCHKPLYFEQPNLERYGMGPGPLMAPVYSSAHFFGSIVLLPAKVAYRPWWTKAARWVTTAPATAFPCRTPRPTAMQGFMSPDTYLATKSFCDFQEPLRAARKKQRHHGWRVSGTFVKSVVMNGQSSSAP